MSRVRDLAAAHLRVPKESSITLGHILHCLFAFLFMDYVETPLSPCGAGTAKEIWQKHLGDDGILGVCADHDRELSDRSTVDVVINWHDADGRLKNRMWETSAKNLPEYLVKSFAIPFYQLKEDIHKMNPFRSLDRLVVGALKRVHGADQPVDVMEVEDPFAPVPVSPPPEVVPNPPKRHQRAVPPRRHRRAASVPAVVYEPPAPANGNISHGGRPIRPRYYVHRVGRVNNRTRRVRYVRRSRRVLRRRRIVRRRYVRSKRFK